LLLALVTTTHAFLMHSFTCDHSLPNAVLYSGSE